MTLDVTVLLPCLNEEKTIGDCLLKARSALVSTGMTFEILVADNGSTDRSKEIALNSGARVVDVFETGYGSALNAGIESSLGKFVLMADADDSYDLKNLQPFLDKLNEGYDLVVGNRFKGGIEKKAMPFLHKYLGNPVLSFLGRLLYKVPISDFHCGIRAFNRDQIIKLKLNSKGMEFASEMIVKASLNKLRISEVPTRLYPDGRDRNPHLNTWRDGWRHLIFLLAASPRFLFLYPGLALFFVGITSIASTTDLFERLLGVKSGLLTLIFGTGFMITGTQIILLSLLMRLFATLHGFLPSTSMFSKLNSYFTLEKGIVLGIFLIITSLAPMSTIVFRWGTDGYEAQNDLNVLEIASLSISLLIVGIQTLFASFFASILQFKSKL